MVLLKIISVGVVAANMGDYIRWVNAQSTDSNKKYFPILTALQASRDYDEIVVTTMSRANPNFFDIYVKLNGAYNKAKVESKILA